MKPKRLQCALELSEAVRIPNSGLIILTLVLKAARLPDAIVEFALPIVYSIDFIVARLRSAVNVMGDIQVAILLDAGNKANQSARSVELVQSN